MDRDKLKSDVMIDPDELDVECCRQADVFFEWAEQAIESKSKVDKLKRECQQHEAFLLLDVRHNPEQYKLQNPTEKSIAAVVCQLVSYIEMQKGLEAVEKENAMLWKAVEALDQKKRSLDNLVKLHGQNYFAGPKVPHDLSEAWKNRRQGGGDRATERTLANVRRVAVTRPKGK